jgi:hypothetical protein
MPIDEHMRVLIEKVKVAVKEYLDTQPEDALLHISLVRDTIAGAEGGAGDGVDKAPIIMCPFCFSVNRLPRGVEGAVCGNCKKSFPKVSSSVN